VRFQEKAAFKQIGRCKSKQAKASEGAVEKRRQEAGQGASGVSRFTSLNDAHRGPDAESASVVPGVV